MWTTVNQLMPVPDHRGVCVRTGGKTVQKIQHSQRTARMARMAAAKLAPIAPTPQADFCPHADDALEAKSAGVEPELRDVLAKTSWASILLPFGIGLAAIAASLVVVLTTN
jgi:hypothetical protein